MVFSNDVWITRKARINTSERLKQNDLWSQILIVYYSLFIIMITIIDIKNDNINFEILTLILSILILVISVFIFSMNYKERSIKLQTSYIKLRKIYRNVLEKEKNNESIDELFKEYDSILECTENHSQCDYLKVMYEVRNNEKYKEQNGNFTFINYCSYYWCKFKNKLFILILFILPIFVLFIAFENKM